MTSALTAKEERILNPRPRRHHRPTYSLAEFRLGLALLLLLAGIASWIAWRGAHPDPTLFADPHTLLDPGVSTVPRGSLPQGLAAAGWGESGLARFDAQNLYVKIDGRADFFLARGFRELAFVTLRDAGTPGTTVDVEFYDLGSPANASGALAVEKPPELPAQSKDGATWYVARNALFLARGPYYVRAIGSDEGPAVLAQLEHLRGVFQAALPAGVRSWGHALFADRLGIAPGRVAFQQENAFSFGFAKDVYVATMDDGETELFVTTAADATAASVLARRFEKGFLEYGEPVPRADGTWVKDRYLGSFARAASVGAKVVGVRGAARIEAAEKALARLSEAVGAGA